MMRGVASGIRGGRGDERLWSFGEKERMEKCDIKQYMCTLKNFASVTSHS